MFTVEPMARKKSFQFFANAPRKVEWPGFTRKLLSQTPFGHIMGEWRQALLYSPCCRRRLRVRIAENCKGWKHEAYVRCPGCRQFWRVSLVLTELGFARKAKLSSILTGQKQLKTPPKLR